VADASQECMDADCDCQNNQGEQANRYEKNAEDFHLAAGDCQHRGDSVSAAGDTAKHH